MGVGGGGGGWGVGIKLGGLENFQKIYNRGGGWGGGVGGRLFGTLG